MKKIKNKLLKTSIATLSAAVVAAPLLATTLTSKSITPVKNTNEAVTNNTSNAATYYTITYNTVDGVTLSGVTKAKIRSGRIFGSAQKPTAVSSISGATFLGWSKAAGDKDQIVTNDTKVTSALSLYPVFDTTVTVTLFSGNGKFTMGGTQYERINLTDVTIGTKLSALLSNKGITITPNDTEYIYDGDWTTDGTDTLPASTTEITKNIKIYPKYVSSPYAPTNSACQSATTVRAIENSTIYFSWRGTPTSKIQYSTTGDAGTWNEAKNGKIINLSKGENLYLKGSAEDETKGLNDNSNYWNIKITGKCNLGGSVMGLLYDGAKPTEEKPQTTIPSTYCFYYLFNESYGLSKISSTYLSATTLTSNCYQYMFQKCTSLTAAPELPAITLADYCYSNMFKYCYSLKSAPALNAGKDGNGSLAYGCYSLMFYQCENLTAAPDLPAITLADYCYSEMFSNCTSLKTAPALSVEELKTRCYDGMFKNCTSLTSAPTLSSQTLADYCYNAMFSGCTSLTSAPTLPAKELKSYCYGSMFNNCTSLTSAPTLSSQTLADYCYSNMFYGCEALETAPALPAETLKPYCYQYMFQKCTSLTAAPTLSSNTLAKGCYKAMFNGCTLLTAAPTLSSQTLADECYMAMFSGCTSLTSAPALSATTLANYCYTEMFKNCSKLKVTTDSTVSGATLIFTCPTYSSSSISYPVTNMFASISSESSFTGTPTAETSYYYY